MKKGIILGDIPENIIRGNNKIVFSIQPNEVFERDYSRVKTLFLTLEQCGVDSFQKIVLSFAYDDDKREIVEIPEIQEYFSYMFDLAPHMFYWFAPNPFNQTLVMMLGGIKILRKDYMSKKVSFTPKSMPDYIAVRERIKNGLLEYSKVVNDLIGTQTVIEQLQLNKEI